MIFYKGFSIMDDRLHTKMVNILWNNKSILCKAIGSDDVLVRMKEYVIDPDTNERADLVFQDKYDPYRPIPDTSLFVVELKSDFVDHSVLGQLKKAVQFFEKKARITSHWDNVIGMAIAPKFTKSGLALIRQEGYRAFSWDVNKKTGVTLTEIDRKFYEVG